MDMSGTLFESKAELLNIARCLIAFAVAFGQASMARQDQTFPARGNST